MEARAARLLWRGLITQPQWSISGSPPATVSSCQSGDTAGGCYRRVGVGEWAWVRVSALGEGGKTREWRHMSAMATELTTKTNYSPDSPNSMAVVVLLPRTKPSRFVLGSGASAQSYGRDGGASKWLRVNKNF